MYLCDGNAVIRVAAQNAYHQDSVRKLNGWECKFWDVLFRLKLVILKMQYCRLILGERF